MRDGVTWSAAVLVVLSIGVAIWCARLEPPKLEPARDRASVAAEPPAGDPLLFEVGARPQGTPSDPACDFGEVVLIAAHAEPAHSAASVRMGDGATKTRRAGEQLAGYTVEAIHFDHVVFRRGDERCAMQIGEAPKPRRGNGQLAAGSVQLPGWLAQEVRHVGPGEIAVQRAAVDRIIEEAAVLTRGTRATPTTDGLRLARVRGALASLGFREGDVLHTVNGFSLGDPQQMLEAYARLRSADRLTLSFSRDDRRGDLDVSVL